MPSTATITAFYTFAPLTEIKSAEMNNNFSTFRGHIIPIDTDTATSSNLTHDLGAYTHMWRGSYFQYAGMYQNTASSIPATPDAGRMAMYFKDDGYLYKKLPSGVESQISDTTPTVQTFLTTTASLYTTPTGCRYIIVEMQGPGAGGGGGGTTGATAGSNPSGGTTFGTLLTAGPGFAGLSGNGNGQGGTGASNTITSPAVELVSVFDIRGNSGGAFQRATAAQGYVMGPQGGSGPLGGGGPPIYTATGGAGVPNTGGGGAGGGTDADASTNYQTGGGGSPGGFLRALIVAPSSTYALVLPAGGAGGAAGTGGYAGGPGAKGCIRVFEHY